MAATAEGTDRRTAREAACRCAEVSSGTLPSKPPSARAIARLLTSRRDRLSTADTTLAIAVAQAVPALPVTRDLLAPFHALLRSKSCANLDAWLADAANSLLGSFASGMGADRDAVAATITDP